MDQFGYYPAYVYGRLRQYIQPYINMINEVGTANHIIDNIYLGDISFACSYTELKTEGITNVITAIRGVVEQFPNDFQYMLIDIGDLQEENIMLYFDRCIDFIKQSTGKTLVHCMYGRSRSPSIVCAYLIKEHHMSVDEAVAFIKAKRDISINSGFMKQLNDYHVALH